MLDLLAAIESVDPPSLVLWAVAIWAAAMYPLGMMLGAECSMCCGCPVCEGPQCCGDEWPRFIGECCGGEWRTDEGVCCGGEWYPAGTAGECCNGVWQTGEGVCCDGVWHTDGGDCCGGVWYPNVNPCPEGLIYLRWGEFGQCCGCVFDTVYDPRVEEDVSTAGAAAAGELCCDCEPGPLFLGYVAQESGPALEVGCKKPCCVDGNCTEEFAADCAELGGTWLASGCCRDDPCPIACCSEDADGTVDCEQESAGACDLPKRAAVGNDCATGCLGECCIDGVSQGQTTQPECDAIGGCWGGLGSTACAGVCRSPFSESCCESMQSSAAGLTFTQPRRRRCPEFTGTLRVTVTGTTDSAILIHGTPFGVTATPAKRCPINHTFLLCWDKFNIEPVPCGTNFRGLDIDVCWQEEATQAETLIFSGCNDIAVWLGACDRGNCVTTLLYVGGGHTSNAEIHLYGDAVIDASGSGAVVLTSAFQVLGSCVESLTLQGTSVAANEISGPIPDGSSVLSVTKTGSGLWRLSGASSYSGGLTVSEGTLVVAVNGVDGFGNPSPVGTGNVSVGGGNPAAFLIDNNSQDELLVERTVTVTAGVGLVTLGGRGSGPSGFTGPIVLDRSVTLQAATSGTVFFGATWLHGSGATVTVGSAGNDGTVYLDSTLPSGLAGVSVAHGTLGLRFSDDIIDTATPVTIATATLDRGGQNQTIDDLTITGAATLTGGGNLTVSATLDGAGSIINAAGTLEINGTNTMTGSVSITGGSVVVSQIVSGPAGNVTSATFTDTTLTVAFASDPESGDEYQLLAGATVQSYGTVTLTGTTKTGTYDSATSTLTID